MLSSVRSRIIELNTYNVNTLLHSPLSEASGSLGDLGTLLPLLLALTFQGSISLPASLLSMGISNILTGLLLGLPLPVQPMKAIAAVALAKGFSMNEIAASGIVMGLFIGFLTLSGSIEWLERRIPRAVIGGIMMGAGLQLAMTAGSDRLLGGIGWTNPLLGDSLFISIGAAIVLLLSSPFQSFPYALFVFLIGLIYGLAQSQNDHTSDIPDQALQITLHIPAKTDFLKATFTASLGQLPLTLLNSIIAIRTLSSSLIPSRPAPTTTGLGISVALMNLLSPWIGGMPTCHGSGGLAGQYRFGARSGASVILLGFVKIVLGVIALWKGESVAIILGAFPKSILGVMVLAAGVELALAGIRMGSGERTFPVGERDGRVTSGLTEREEWVIVMLTGTTLLVFHNDAVGFIVGMVWYYGIGLMNRYKRSLRGRDEDAGEVVDERTRLLPA